jgi:hypothetical protein
MLYLQTTKFGFFVSKALKFKNLFASNEPTLIALFATPGLRPVDIPSNPSFPNATINIIPLFLAKSLIISDDGVLASPGPPYKFF